ncbi:MAG: trypsin-like peptidase domain-containing protein [Deltaproteobacteria bacterium]|nr:trypsin-like peptidase domain-containing protein [Deltaproteobacteria bacterium]
MKLGPAQLGAFFATTVLTSVGAAAVYVHLFAPAAPVVQSATAIADPTPQSATTQPATLPVTPTRPTAPLPPSTDLEGASMADVVARVLPSVVNVRSSQAPRSPYGTPYDLPYGNPYQRTPEPQESLGSGVIVSADGLVVTNNHVVRGATEIRVSLSDGREIPASIVGTDQDSDMALLRLEGASLGLTPIAYGDSSQLRQGDVVLAIGNPFGVGQTVTMGIVSAVGRANVGITALEDFIQTDAAINPGNSGGALISTRGELVGINTAILSRTGGSHGIGFAIPSNMVSPIVDALLAHGSVVRGWLGVGPQELTPVLAEAMHLSAGQRGVLVNHVAPDSPASAAGLRPGDILESVNGERLTSPEHLVTIVATRGAEADLALTVVRGEQRLEVTAHLAQRPQPEGTLPAPTPLPRDLPQRGQGLPPGYVPLPPGMTPDLFAGGGAPSYARPRLQGGTVVAGLDLHDLDDRLRRGFGITTSVTGALVGDVAQGSPGAMAGLEPGDVIVEVNRDPVESVAQFARVYVESGGGVTVLIRRGSSSLYTVLR